MTATILPLPVADLQAVHGAACAQFLLMRAMGDREGMRIASEREQVLRHKLFGSSQDHDPSTCYALEII